MINIGKVFILGDSYSTFEGHIPEGFAPYYKIAGRKETDVIKVEQTWWHQILSETESDLVRNCSYSGTTVCNTGYGGDDYTDISFVGRFDKLVDNGFFKDKKIDTFFVFGGTNDSWANSPLGELKYNGWTKEDLFSVLPAFTYLINRIKENVPGARIINIVNSELKQEIMEGFSSACKEYGVECVQLANVEKNAGHPTIAGMESIKNQVKEQL